jgi:polysaccharide transporter, PST family
LIQKLLKNKSLQVLTENFLSLFSLQAVGYIFPLITFPYLTQHLGLVGFGKYILIQTIFIYLDGIVSYGFKVTATDLVSKSSNKIEEVSSIFCSVLAVKLILLLLVSILLCISVFFIPFIKSNFILIIIGFPYLIGNFLFPVWLFQGMQRMKYITFIHVIAKVFFTCSIFLLVKDANDIIYAVGSYSFGVLLAGIFSIFIAYNMFSLKLYIPSLNLIREQFISGYYVFLSQFSVSMYSSVNTLILGALTSEMTVGIYAIADKVYKMVTALATPFSRALFPFMSQKFSSNSSRYKYVVLKTIMPLFGVFLMIGIIIFFSADLIVNFLLDSGESSGQSVLALKILSIGIPFFPFGAFFTYLLVIQNQKKELFKIVITIVGINLLIIFPFVHYFDVIGICITTIIVTVLVAGLKGRKVISFLSKKTVKHKINR